MSGNPNAAKMFCGPQPDTIPADITVKHTYIHTRKDACQQITYKHT